MKSQKRRDPNENEKTAREDQKRARDRDALRAVLDTIEPLDPDARWRILRSAKAFFGLDLGAQP